MIAIMIPHATATVVYLAFFDKSLESVLLEINEYTKKKKVSFPLYKQ